MTNNFFSPGNKNLFDKMQASMKKADQHLLNILNNNGIALEDLLSEDIDLDEDLNTFKEDG